MADVSSHDWFTPKLTALVAEAEAAGIARDISVAVITDLINGPLFCTAPLQTEEKWNQDIGEPDYLVNENAPTSAAVDEGNAMVFEQPFIGGPRRV